MEEPLERRYTRYEMIAAKTKYICEQTGLRGEDFHEIVMLEIIEGRHLRGKDERGRDKVSESIQKNHGDTYGTDFETIRRNILEHVLSHEECKAVYDELKAIENRDQEDMDE